VQHSKRHFRRVVVSIVYRLIVSELVNVLGQSIGATQSRPETVFALDVLTPSSLTDQQGTHAIRRDAEEDETPKEHYA
jgi:hypothetical protein